MLRDSPMTTILPVADMERSRRFYGSVLGLPEAGRSGDGKYLFAPDGGGLLALMEKPSPVPAEHTAVSFEVTSAEAMVRALTERGVVFDDYDLPGLRTVDKVCVLGSEKAAWFRDPDGNILCVHETLVAPVAASTPG